MQLVCAVKEQVGNQLSPAQSVKINFVNDFPKGQSHPRFSQYGTGLPENLRLVLHIKCVGGMSSPRLPSVMTWEQEGGGI